MTVTVYGGLVYTNLLNPRSCHGFFRMITHEISLRLCSKVSRAVSIRVVMRIPPPLNSLAAFLGYTLAGAWGISFIYDSAVVAVGFEMHTDITSVTIQDVLLMVFICGLAVCCFLIMAAVSAKYLRCSTSV
jgi:hypothetical protein